MNETMNVDPYDVLNLYREGKARGFVAGVIFTMAAPKVYRYLKENKIRVETR